MQDVQLISKDANLIAEIQKICAVTQATLSHSDLISESEISNTHTVLIDAQLDLVINHPNVVLVTLSEPGIAIWQKAIATNAEYAVGTIAAASLGGVLLKMLTSPEIQSLIWSIIERAFSSIFGA